MPSTLQAEPPRWKGYDWPETESSLKSLRLALSAELKPAGPQAIRYAYETLAASYVVSKADEESEILRARAWLETMSDLPTFALKGAIAEWMQRDTAFMPTPGQFYRLASPLISKKRTELNEIDNIFGILQRGGANSSVRDYDPEIARKLRLLVRALASGADLKEMRARGIL